MSDARTMKREVFEYLADLYTDERGFRNLMEDAGIERRKMPAWGNGTIVDNWRAAIDRLADGAAGTDAVPRLLRAVLIEYPAREDQVDDLIRRWEETIEVTRPIKVLFLGATPVDQETIRIGQEFNRIKEALKNRDLARRIDFVERHGVGLTDLVKILLEAEPDIVQFSGHGGKGELYLEGPSGTSLAVTGQMLAPYFSQFNGMANRKPIRCVLLNVCNSEEVAAALVGSVDVAIGTKRPIADLAASAFTETFYQALAHRCVVGDAVRLGQLQMSAVGASQPRPALRFKPDGGAVVEQNIHFDPSIVVVKEKRQGVVDQLRF